MFAVFRDSLKSSGGQLSSFQALMLSLAGRVGAGNIAGVGIAVTLGGPGAVFWMWVTALVGMSSSFFECTLGQVYKRAMPTANCAAARPTTSSTACKI
jgi:AGCS family alanine or glycine:cation symporter